MTILISNRSRCAVPTCETSDEQAGSQRIGRAAALSRPSAFAPPVRPLHAARKGTAGQRKGNETSTVSAKKGSSGCRSRQVGMMHSYIRGKPRERCQQSVRQPQPPKPCARAVVRTPRITVPRRDNASVCRNAGSSRKTQMNVIIQKRNGLWYLIVGSCQIRTPFLETQSREWVVAYARQIYPGAKIFEHD